ncbi:MAG: hypothetical protein MSA76_08485 [Clostridium sp.]|jgi:hypothetical protein|nr:hypothetical protein [Clostridium sp.]DAG35224.1 MAG TPA: hypothetical protein [Caudoviricetes sp.]
MARKGMIDFSQLEDLAEKWEKAGGKVEQLAESCLKAAHKAVTPPIVQDMTRHHRTGSTQESIVTKADVKWDGTKANIPVGFDIKQGGLPSIFLMYGTPRIKKDTKLYADVYGKKAQERIKKAQEETFQKGIKKLLGG